MLAFKRTSHSEPMEKWMERIKKKGGNVIHHSVDQFYRVWCPFLDYIGPDLSFLF